MSRNVIKFSNSTEMNFFWQFSWILSDIALKVSSLSRSKVKRTDFKCSNAVQEKVCKSKETGVKFLKIQAKLFWNIQILQDQKWKGQILYGMKEVQEKVWKSTGTWIKFF